MKKSSILLIYTGGTIGMVKDYASGALKAFNFDKLLESIPEIKQLDCHVDSVSFKEPIDSSNMNPSHWVQIATLIEENYDSHDGFVVLHGSDTMSYTASALSFMLENLGKPVIFTGSQLPIGDLRTDAKENLITSIQIAALRKKNKPVVQEVGLYFEYKLYRGNRTTKINAEHFQAFASLNYPELIESGVFLKVSEEYLLRNKGRKKFTVHKEMDQNVAILKLFPGIGPLVLQSVVRIPGLKALVLETYGAGNAPTEPWVIDILREAKEKNIHIVNVTQCSGGSVSMGRYETSKQLEELQVINGKDITTEAAVAKLMYLLGSNVSPKLFKSIFETSLRGEIEEN
ncbi:asparaginase [Zobellia galactanivorans]|uniref:asparaginase n=1 Tax=Zobellia galactanivorans (strain DSM 12802 / CCUG 47099 / CIP 106680 / NCIMB 13871 / Dsij) TaxID=63186 RepID=G0LBV9_ZOBGA|nr:MULTISPECIES: asparaginase [Zobellia]MBU3026263.1 asparaginase [Zobellia galactanivorans]MDO6807265.1 asparaginase [Zobellia galactanivorans]OWW27329.1 L-asparaginase 1 [Zobellia sp. OII3]CAZ96485.1 Asparaginase, type I [Zobellia galactanivorans]